LCFWIVKRSCLVKDEFETCNTIAPALDLGDEGRRVEERGRKYHCDMWLDGDGCDRVESAPYPGNPGRIGRAKAREDYRGERQVRSGPRQVGVIVHGAMLYSGTSLAPLSTGRVRPDVTRNLYIEVSTELEWPFYGDDRLC
jgi:hypothetical protein